VTAALSAPPAMMGLVAARTTVPLVGRDTELEQLCSWLGADEGDAARPRVPAVLLAGDAGVGKTRLLAEARDRLVAQGRRVVAGHCLDLGDSGLPYLPFTELLGRLATELPDTVAEVVGHHPALARLQPGRRTLAGEGESVGAVDRSALFDGVRALLEAAGRERPLVVVVEDAHWADQSTRDLLTVLFTREPGPAVSLVVSYRADDLHRRHPLRRHLAEWSRLSGVRRLALSPLADDAVVRLVGELVPGGLGAAETDDIVARAEGNAFFVEELASAAAEPGRWVPTELADVLLVRLDRLDDDARQVVRAASVAGRTVSHALLAAASGLPDVALDAGLRAAVESHVLVPDGDRYAFRHALLGEAVYDDLLPGERVRLHQAFAAALLDGEVPGTAAELARHSRLAHDLDTALHASIRAGRDAMAVGGPDEAVTHLEQALQLLGDPARGRQVDVDRAELVAALAEALTASGRPQRAAALLGEELDRLPASAPPGWRSRLLALRAFLLLITETEDDPSELSAEAVALLPADETPLRARVLATHARILAAFRRHDEAQTVALEALALAERLGLTDTVSDLVVTLSQARHTGPRAGLREALVEAVASARAAGAAEAELRAQFLLGRSYEDHADWEQAERTFRRGLERGDELGLPWAPYAFEARWHLVFQYVVRGQWDAALEAAETPARPPALQAALLDLFRLHVEQARGGDVSDRLPPLRRLWATEGLFAVHSAALEMVEAARRGDAEGTLRPYDDAVAVLTRLWGSTFPARVRLAATALGALADVLPATPSADHPALLDRAARLQADGREVAACFVERAGGWGPEGRAWSARLEAEVLRLRWLGGDEVDHAALVAAWREVEQLFAAYGEAHQVATVRVVLSGVLRAVGDTAGAREVGDLAREQARALGARPLLDALVATGARPVRQSASSEVLTPRETEILGLVAQGRTNGEIGRQLFIATKTVSVHVSNILGKLGAASRTEAAALARRRGLLD
jgi:DNA-binding CsgD family transcriptional regulator/tetratricopeptide (TPR) repeat protein